MVGKQFSTIWADDLIRIVRDLHSQRFACDGLIHCDVETDQHREEKSGDAA